MINENTAQPMHPADIKAMIEKSGSSQAQIANEISVSKTAVCRVIKGKDVSRRVAAAIAEKIGKPIGAIWPGIYE